MLLSSNTLWLFIIHGPFSQSVVLNNKTAQDQMGQFSTPDTNCYCSLGSAQALPLIMSGIWLNSKLMNNEISRLIS